MKKKFYLKLLENFWLPTEFLWNNSRIFLQLEKNQTSSQKSKRSFPYFQQPYQIVPLKVVTNFWKEISTAWTERENGLNNKLINLKSLLRNMDVNGHWSVSNWRGHQTIVTISTENWVMKIRKKEWKASGFLLKLLSFSNWLRKWPKSSFWTKQSINNFHELIFMILLKKRKLWVESTTLKILSSITILLLSHLLMPRISKRLIFLKLDGMRFQLT